MQTTGKTRDLVFFLGILRTFHSRPRINAEARYFVVIHPQSALRRTLRVRSLQGSTESIQAPFEAFSVRGSHQGPEEAWHGESRIWVRT